jgi:hypothetical protein
MPPEATEEANTSDDDRQEKLPLIAPQKWRCSHSGGGGLDSDGDTCRHCDGLGFC